MRPAHRGLTEMGGFTGMVAFDGNGFLELGNTDFALCEGCGCVLNGNIRHRKNFQTSG